MLERVAGRIVTGPVAFLVAGLLDLMLYSAGSLWRRLVRRLRWRA